MDSEARERDEAHEQLARWAAVIDIAEVMVRACLADDIDGWDDALRDLEHAIWDVVDLDRKAALDQRGASRGQ